MELIRRFFPNLSKEQFIAFEKLSSLYNEWNAKINVISRKDMENLYERHVLHSLAIAKFISFPAHSNILDVGTGGGFPGIPLAIVFSDCNFTLIDSIGKKITVVQEVVKALELKNITALKANVNEIKEKFEFIVSRAVCSFPEFDNITKKNRKTAKPNQKNGIIYLKGGDLSNEIAPYKQRVKIEEIFQWFPLEFFETKKVVYLPFK